MKQKDLQAGEDYAYDHRWHGTQRVRVLDPDTTREQKVRYGTRNQYESTATIVGALVQVIDETTGEAKGEAFIVERSRMRLLTMPWANHVAAEEAKQAREVAERERRKRQVANQNVLVDALRARGFKHLDRDTWSGRSVAVVTPDFPALAALLGVTLPHPEEAR